MGAKNLYIQDFFAWTQTNIEYLKDKKFSSLDIINLIKELEDMGSSNKRAIENYLVHFMSHMLKWEVQPNLWCNSWIATIIQAKLKIRKLLCQNPSLKHFAETSVLECYEEAILEAIKDTGFSRSIFSEKCPFTLDKLLNTDLSII